MSNALGVDIVPSHPGPSVYQDMALRDGLAPYGLLGPPHAQTPSNGIFPFLNLTHVLDDEAARRKKRISRIGIVQKLANGTLPLVNWAKLHEPVVAENAENTLYTVSTVKYFDDRGFLGTIEYYGSVDIIVSLHGSHLTTIPFMPPCGSILDLFPEDHCLPDFFGSLASGAGLAYSYFHLNDGPDQFINKQNKSDLCPFTGLLVKGIVEIVKDRKKCVEKLLEYLPPLHKALPETLGRESSIGSEDSQGPVSQLTKRTSSQPDSSRGIGLTDASADSAVHVLSGRNIV